jgi:demethylmenaquinone methyltransferase/2-methoxy-6-polyprenyl-1,4-benzoquinol methylase
MCANWIIHAFRLKVKQRIPASPDAMGRTGGRWNSTHGFVSLAVRPPRRFRSDTEYVRSLFDAIAYRYDLLNHLLSGGFDLYWRRRAVQMLREAAPGLVLDVAAGTGDFAIAASRLGPERIIGIDISDEMLAIGRAKIARRGLSELIQLRSGDAQKIIWDGDPFDAAIVAFGVRNFQNLESGLSEMHRVLRPGGRIVVLEFSRPAHSPFRGLYFFYFRRILPMIGRLLSGSEEAYAYLPETVMNFPEGPAFLDVLRRVGFSRTEAHRLTLGIATVYLGGKKDDQKPSGTPQ